MLNEHLLPAVAAPSTLAVVDALDAGHLAEPTPCAGWDVRALVNHLLLWGPALEGAARKELAPIGDPVLDRTAGDWRGTLRGQFERLAEAWSVPGSWEGVSRMGGPWELPAALIGGMVLGEFVLHGWDLARAIGLRPRWDDGLLQMVYVEVAKSADQGRSMGVYGPEVPVADTAPLLDRILGMSGRDPNWSA